MRLAGKLILFQLYFLISIQVNAQIEFSKKVHDFGILENWNPNPAEFDFTNSGSTPFVVIHAGKSTEVRVLYPRAEIQPNENGKISVFFEPYNIGPFNEKILIYTNISTKPTVLVIKGKIKSLINCPNINNPINNIDLSYEQIGFVIDSKTRAPIAKAMVILKSIEESLSCKTSKEGRFHKQIKLGVYHFKISSEGYYHHEESIYLKKNSPILYFELDPMEIVTNEEIPTISDPEIQVIEEEPRVEPESDIEPEPKIEVIIDPKEDTIIFEIPIELDNIVKPSLEEDETDIPEPDIFASEPNNEMEPEIEEKPSENDDITIEIETNEIKPNNLESDVIITPGEVLDRESFAANNVVFLIDVSSSMKKGDKLVLLKIAMIHLTKILRDIDLVSVITYASDQKVLLTSIPADQKQRIIPVIDSLKSKGMTYGIKGLKKAYEIAMDNYIEGGNNQIIVATDGEFNSDDYSELELIATVRKNARQGIIISVIGFGKNPEAIKRMERIALLGKGNYLHIYNEEHAKSILIDEIRLNSRKY